MMASYNQKHALSELAHRYEYYKILAELEARDIENQPMNVDHYKAIRNAICFNNPQRAMKMIQTYPLKSQVYYEDEEVIIQ